ncbi:Uma2 family endonuclease [Streptomyces sp. 21So2-11]|uniref:Uma2 family endonuclease n=1 Tax=Streptomyces sp. 21So2-11 TaxID=3144408 RepID=UPI00321B1368
MSVVEGRSSVLTQDEFEDLARHAIRANEALRLEFVNGKMGIKAAPDGDHGRIIAWLMQICIQSQPGMWLFPEQGLRVETYHKGNARPRAYAESGLPVYLLIDRDACEVKVHSQPDGVRYEQVTTVSFGKSVVLPDPVGIELDTEPLKDWVH